jgi:hypothetical protein
MTTEARKMTAMIRRIDADRRIVYAEVYAPNVLDTYGEFMLPEHVEEMAHKFMQLDLANVIDTNHDNIPNGSYPIESFVARAGDPDFTEGAWVMGVKCPRDEVWEAVLKGDLNGFSFEAMVNLVEYEVECSVVRDHVGKTRTIKGVDHEHLFFVQVDDRGRVVRGMTSPGPDGHTHIIKHGTMTEKVSGHSHRFDLV